MKAIFFPNSILAAHDCIVYHELSSKMQQVAAGLWHYQEQDEDEIVRCLAECGIYEDEYQISNRTN